MFLFASVFSVGRCIRGGGFVFPAAGIVQSYGGIAVCSAFSAAAPPRAASQRIGTQREPISPPPKCAAPQRWNFLLTPAHFNKSLRVHRLDLDHNSASIRVERTTQISRKRPLFTTYVITMHLGDTFLGSDPANQTIQRVLKHFEHVLDM